MIINVPETTGVEAMTDGTEIVEEIMKGGREMTEEVIAREETVAEIGQEIEMMTEDKAKALTLETIGIVANVVILTSPLEQSAIDVVHLKAVKEEVIPNNGLGMIEEPAIETKHHK